MVFRIWDMRIAKLLQVSFQTSDEALQHVRRMRESEGANESDLIIIPTLN